MTEIWKVEAILFLFQTPTPFGVGVNASTALSTPSKHPEQRRRVRPSNLRSLSLRKFGLIKYTQTSLPHALHHPGRPRHKRNNCPAGRRAVWRGSRRETGKGAVFW